MKNRVIEDRAMRRRMSDKMRDSRRGVRGSGRRDSAMRRRDMRNDRMSDYRDRNDMRDNRRDRDYNDSADYGDYKDYNDYGDYGDYDYADNADNADGADYEDYAVSKEKQIYHKKLKEWIEKLKKKDRFHVSKDNVIQQAKTMGIKFDNYSEEEFYATYLMRVSDDKEMANAPQSFIISARNFLEDDDSELKGSEKLCKYLYAIVLDED